MDGLDEGDWAKTIDGVTFGNRTIHVSWPPVDGRVQLIDDRDYETPADAGLSPTFTLPEQCRSIGEFVAPEQISAYANANPDTTAVFYVVGNVYVLQVAGDPEVVRQNLATEGAEPCLELVEYSTTQLDAAQNAVVEATDRGDLPEYTWGNYTTTNYLEVDVAALDADTARQISQVVDDPSILVLHSPATRVLAGT